MNNRKYLMRCLAITLTLFVTIIFVASCGSKETAPEDRVYLEESEYDAALSDGDSYKGKWIKIVGKVFNVDKDGEDLAIQAWYDPKDADQPFIVYLSKDLVDSVKVDDFILVDGEISGVFKGENALGGEITNPIIKAESVTVGTYDELYAPAESTKEVGETKDQHGLKVTVDRIEYAKEEARVYITVKNDSGDKASVYTFNAKAIQDGKQIDHEDNYDAGEYDDMGDVLDGASKEGILRFQGLDPEKPVKIQIEAYSDNYEIEIEDYVFDIE